MKQTVFKPLIWIPVVIWMIVIFLLSSQSAAESSKISGGITVQIAKIFVSDYANLSEAEQFTIVDGIHVVVRKAAHMFLYSILSILVLVALKSRRSTFNWQGVLALLICFLYACSDEIHQLFVAGRGCQWQDVAIDMLAVFIGILVSSLCLMVYETRCLPNRKNHKRDSCGK